MKHIGFGAGSAWKLVKSGEAHIRETIRKILIKHSADGDDIK